MQRIVISGLLTVCTIATAAVAVAGGSAFTILDGINQAVQTNPGVGEAAANRRATEAELRQNQSTLLPQVRLEGKIGKEKFDFKDEAVPPLGNKKWLNAGEGSVVIRQLVFDGFTSLNEIWRQAARVDAAAYRTRERTELIALDAAEAYIDVIRYTRLVALANENVVAHQKILENVKARYDGGRAGEGDLQQVIERVEAALAAAAQFRQNLDEARGRYRKVIGIEPYNLRVPNRLAGLPASRDQALAVTIQHNPTIQAAQADREAAKYGFKSTAGAFMPTVTLEGRALYGDNTATTFGHRTDVSGYLVGSWDIFRGGQDSWKRAEMAERYQEQTMRHARLQRDAFESIDKAWAARTLTADRITALIRQIAADRKVIVSYQKEYELGQRSLIDLLNAQNQLFNGLVSLESTKSVAVFADYQLLAAMGGLLEYLKLPHPVDAEALDTLPFFGLIPTRLPPVFVKLPKPGSEPLNIKNEGDLPPASQASGQAPAQKQAGYFGDRWPTWQAAPETSVVTALQWLFIRDNPQAAQDVAQTSAAEREAGPLAFAPEALWTAPVKRRR